MDNNKLKIFAQETRLKLINLVSAQLQLVLNTDSAELRGREKDVKQLRAKVSKDGVDSVVEEMAYTWFNRVMALRFMDANGYNRPMVVTPAEGASRPEILADALSGSVDESLNIPQSTIDELLQGRSGDSHPQETLYRKLFIAKCNELGSVMPFLFEKIQDYTELLLPDDLLSELSFVTDIRKGMSDEDCQHEQIVGWLYQFYITDRKQEAENNKSRKGGLRSDEQAAATQLFTPDWIVRYMVENTLGRIWLTLHPKSAIRQQMKYYIDPADTKPDPIPEHINSVKDIRFVDPCMGSGHVLVYAFSLYAKMYEEEGYQPKEIPNLIFDHNLYGMDIDRRCYQLASFALVMTACGYAGRRYLRHATAPKVLALQPIEHDVIESTGDWSEDSLVWQFEHIDTIGSLLKITPEECEAINVRQQDIFGHAQQIMKTEAEYLSRKYDCVVTNPPYLGKGFDNYLKSYVNEEYPDGKADLMAAFMVRSLDYCVDGGKMSMINMQSWMFLSSYLLLRMHLLKSKHIDSLLHLGPHTFDELSGEVVQNSSFVVSNNEPKTTGIYYRLVDGKNCADKERMFLSHISSNETDGKKIYYPNVNQSDFQNIPGLVIGYWISTNIIAAFKGSNVSDFGISDGQNITGDNNKYLRLLWEVSRGNSGKDNKWVPIAKGGAFRRWYGNIDNLINWSSTARDEYKKNPVARIQEKKLWYRIGITWNLISSGGNTGFRLLTDDTLFNKAAPTIVMKKNRIGKTNYILGFLNSIVARKLLNLINPTFNTNIAEVFSLGLKFSNIDGITNVVSQNIKLSKLDWDSHETSWDFQTNSLVALLKSAECKDFSDIGQIDLQNRPNRNAKQTKSQCETDQIASQNVPFCNATDNQDVTETTLENSCKDISWCFDSEQSRHDYLTSMIRLSEMIGSNEHQGKVGTLELAVEAFKSLWTARFMQLHDNEEELNRQFIDIYGLQDELTPDVPLKEITILQNGEISVEGDNINWHDDVLMKQLISYLIGCSMGRYAIEKPGLIIANQGETIDDFHKQVAEPTADVDDDGIIPVLDGDYFPDDATERIKESLRSVFGESNYAKNLSYMEQVLGKDIRSYLTKDFYKDHCKMYQKRPIYWMFASKKGTFQALVYMHRITPGTLSRLLANYVQPFIAMIESDKRQQDELHAREDITTKEKNRAQKLSDAYNKQLIELHDYEQQLMELASHRIAIDLDDGVKVNYAKYGDLVVNIK